MDIKKLLFFDCEWVPIARDYDELHIKFPKLCDAWNNRCDKWNNERLKKSDKELSYSEFFELEGSFYPEFIKIICISYGYLNKSDEFVTSSVYGDDERNILESFNKLLVTVKNKGMILGGYSIKRFDLPYLGKRMMINDISPSKLINLYGTKPWDVNVFDLPEVWSMGCNQEAYTPFEWASVALGIETSKDDIRGGEVKKVYYTEGDIGMQRIRIYCEKDVLKTYELAKKIIDLS